MPFVQLYNCVTVKLFQCPIVCITVKLILCPMAQPTLAASMGAIQQRACGFPAAWNSVITRTTSGFTDISAPSNPNVERFLAAPKPPEDKNTFPQPTQRQTWEDDTVGRVGAELCERPGGGPGDAGGLHQHTGEGGLGGGQRIGRPSA